jgi:hypothetical protein
MLSGRDKIPGKMQTNQLSNKQNNSSVVSILKYEHNKITARNEFTEEVP